MCKMTVQLSLTNMICSRISQYVLNSVFIDISHKFQISIQPDKVLNCLNKHIRHVNQKHKNLHLENMIGKIKKNPQLYFDDQACKVLCDSAYLNSPVIDFFQYKNVQFNFNLTLWAFQPCKFFIDNYLLVRGLLVTVTRILLKALEVQSTNFLMLRVL